MSVISSDIVVKVLMIVFGIVVFLAGLLMYIAACKLVRGEISRQRYMGMGFKIKEAFASDEAWYRINREGAKLMIGPSQALMVCGLASALSPLLVPSFERDIFIVTMTWIVLIALLLSGYVIWVKRTEPGRSAAR